MTQKHEIQFAQRMEQLPPYLFGMINKMKTEKRLNGDDVIDLGMGNPVDPTPAPIGQRAVPQKGHLIRIKGKIEFAPEPVGIHPAKIFPVIVHK